MICEIPKIKPLKQELTQNLAKLMKIDVEQICIKATTTEKMGFLGRGEGIGCFAHSAHHQQNRPFPVGNRNVHYIFNSLQAIDTGAAKLKYLHRLLIRLFLQNNAKPGRKHSKGLTKTKHRISQFCLLCNALKNYQINLRYAPGKKTDDTG
jgi:hypothetical protein